jgi:lysophospholipase L1-like esterase
VKVVYFGDSITAGFQHLKAHENVWNLGIGGDKTVDLIGRFLSVTRIRPDRLIVMIGTNDYLVKQRIWQDFIDIDYAVMIDALFTLIQDNLPTTDVHIVSIPPIRWPEQLDVASSNADIDRYNTILHTKATQYGFGYIDLAVHLKDDDNGIRPSYTTDGVHFSEAGYAVYYDLIRPYLEG